VRATIWGCRGSVAAPGPDTLRYGGNTSCVEVRLRDGTIVVLDAGTGLRGLGRRLLADGVEEVHLLLSHLHLDHLVGLGFFAPLFTRGVQVHMWGPASPVEGLHDRITRYLSPPLFPVHLAEVPSLVQLHDAREDPWACGSARIVAARVSHNGPTLGYRIEEDGQSLAYIPDHEPGKSMDLESVEADWISGFGVASRASVLLHDAQYSAEEYPSHIGWGHSSIEHVVTLGKRADVDQLVLFHHDPYHSDDELEAMLREAVRLWGDRPNPPVLAHEGMVIEVGETVTVRGGVAGGTPPSPPGR
jgi:phosphoribosyl 1,2-cyclic phosphodiesterase